MSKFLVLFFGLFAVALFANQQDPIYGQALLENIAAYEKGGEFSFAKWFVLLQGKYFAPLFLGVLILVLVAFSAHYAVIGPKVFPHDDKKVKVFTVFHRFIHLLAAVSFMVLVPTGLVMIFGSTFGGGSFVRICKDLHVYFTFMFMVSVLPMMWFWVKYATFKTYDIKWMMILGGYLSKEKKPVPAGKFNAGQKAWFWTCTLGGIVMIATGLLMYMQDSDFGFLRSVTGLSQIDILRASAIIHNVMGVAVMALFITHVYMACFAIKDAYRSMVDGNMGEEEIRILHHEFYKELKEKGRL